VREDEVQWRRELSLEARADAHSVTCFYVVTGPHGVGKSTLFEYLCQRTSGALYVKLLGEVDFGMALGKALNYAITDFGVWKYLKTSILPTDALPPESKEEPLQRVLAHLTNVSKRYNELFGTYLTLVIDDIEQLPDQTTTLLVTWARHQADSNFLRCIFLSSDSAVEHIFMKTCVTAIRASHFVLGEVSSSLATKFIELYCSTDSEDTETLEEPEKTKNKVSEANITKIISVVGGNMLILKTVATYIQKQVECGQYDVDKVITHMLSLASTRFEAAQLGIYHIKGASKEKLLCFKILLNLKPSLSSISIAEMADVNNLIVEITKQLAYLLKVNILFFNANTREYSFHDSLVAYWFKQNYDYFATQVSEEEKKGGKKRRTVIDQ